jgi:hypothetical protein
MMSVSRRTFINAVGAALAVPVATRGQEAALARTDALPLRTTGIEHLGIMVRDVERSGRFYGQLFNP